jgi:polynucleotide 5'-kinase involved in rRNA processing
MEVPIDETVNELARAIVQILDNHTELSISETIKELIANPAELVKPTTRMRVIYDETNEVEMLGIFNVHHHMVAATDFFNTFYSFKRQTRAVIFGHKNQGKTQFLFFLVKLLQALGEGVVYLDVDISPPAEAGAAVTAEWLNRKSRKAKHNLKFWGEQFTAFLQNKGEEATDVQ